MLVKKERIPVVHILLIGLLPSFLKIMIYRLKGYKIGNGVSISLGAVVMGRDVKIGDHVKIGFFTIIRGNSITINRRVKIGSMTVIDTEKIFIDEEARINEQVYIGGMKTPKSEIRMGKRTIIMQLSSLNPTLPIIIGDDSGIGGHCLLFTHGSWNDQLEGFPVKFAPITLGKKVWLPWRVFVMPGVTIGDNVVIGADSLITSDIPANSLAAGNPAKVLKQNYPAAPSDIQKEEMIQSVLDDFFDYLNYIGFTINKNASSLPLKATITKSGITSELVYVKNVSEIPSSAHKDNVLILFAATPGEIKSCLQKDWKMILAPGSRLRLGHSAAGEEMAAFFSRYGTRFERLD